MGSSHIRQIQFLILSILISAALCYTNHGSSASESVLKSFPDDGGGTPASKFAYTIEDPETKIPCTLANMSISVAVSYATKQKTEEWSEIKIPSNAVAKGACGSMVSEMSLVWETQEHDKFQQNVVKFVLFNDRTNFSVFSIDVDLFLDSANFPDAADERRTTRSNIDLGLFDAPVADGLHKCPQDRRRIKVDNDTTLIVSDVSFIAFNTKKDYGQRKETICEDATNTKVFPIKYEEKRYGVAMLARMSFVLEIPYLTINDTIANYTEQFSKMEFVIGYISKSFIDDTLSGYVWLFHINDRIASYGIRLQFNQDTDGVAYISDVDLDITIFKEDLPDAKYDVIRKLTNKFVLFPAPSDSGIVSCSRRITLNMEDVRLHITDVLLVMFDKTGDFLSKQVIDYDTQPRLTAKDFNYAVREKHGDAPCIVANMSITMRIPYDIQHTWHTVHTNITVPTNATTHGFCGPSLSKMELMWPAEDSQLNSVAFYLSRDSNFRVFHMETNIYTDNTSFPNIIERDAHQWKLQRSNLSLGMFVGPKNNGWYNCWERQEIISIGSSRIIISNVSLIAFNDQEDLNNKYVYGCPRVEEPNDVEPHPFEAAFKYVMREKGKSFACILANMTISVKVTYRTKSKSERETTFLVPKDGVNVTGQCDYRTHEMTLSWRPEGAVPDPDQPYKTKNSITLTFSGDTLTYRVSMIKVGFYLDEKNFPDALESRYSITKMKLDLFSSYVGSVYKCDLETVVELMKVQLTFNDVALTAFNSNPNVTNLMVDECIVIASFNTTEFVAIFFGCFIISCVLSLIIFACVKHYKKQQRLSNER